MQQIKVKVRRDVTQSIETRDTGFVFHSSHPLQEGTSALERCGTTKVTEATKAATKASPYSPTKNTTKASSVSPLKVLVEVAQPSHKVGVTPQQGGSQLHHEARSRLPPPRGSTRGVPTTGNLPHKDPHKRRPR
ncbi:Hypothetical predicted protein, partial [Olea europaea subsp. europaea]